jgi:anti-anti-sigma factor
MALAGVTPFGRPVPGLTATMSSEGTTTVVALRGEADVATLPVLLDVLARAIAIHEGPVVIDLAGAQLIDTATVRALDRARQFLATKDRDLTFRSPSKLPARVLDFFALSDLVERRGSDTL